MKLKPIGANKTELHIDGAHILFSYRTPVAAWIDGEYFKTDKHWSKTTTKHINSWVHLATEKPQSFFDELARGN